MPGSAFFLDKRLCLLTYVNWHLIFLRSLLNWLNHWWFLKKITILFAMSISKSPNTRLLNVQARNDLSLVFRSKKRAVNSHVKGVTTRFVYIIQENQVCVRLDFRFISLHCVQGTIREREEEARSLHSWNCIRRNGGLPPLNTLSGLFQSHRWTRGTKVSHNTSFSPTCS